MKQRIFIVHRWDGSPDEYLYKYIEKELDKKGFDVHLLKMPSSSHPDIETWVGFLRQNSPHPTEHMHFIGHSIGCQTILRYIQTLPLGEKIGKVVLIAPWTRLQGIENEPESKKIAKPWIETPIDWSKIVNHTEKFVCIFSDNDYYVSLSETELFKEELHAKIIIEKNKGHFTEDDGVKKLPSVIECFK